MVRLQPGSESRVPQGPLARLAAELELARRLCIALQAERRALESASLVDVGQSAAERGRLLAQLEIMTRERIGFARSCGVQPDLAGLSSMVPPAERAELERHWRALRAAIAEAARLNRDNGAFVHRQAEYLRIRRSGLTGPDDSATYFHDGLRRPASAPSSALAVA